MYLAETALAKDLEEVEVTRGVLGADVRRGRRWWRFLALIARRLVLH